MRGRGSPSVASTAPLGLETGGEWAKLLGSLHAGPRVSEKEAMLNIKPTLTVVGVIVVSAGLLQGCNAQAATPTAALTTAVAKAIPTATSPMMSSTPPATATRTAVPTPTSKPTATLTRTPRPTHTPSPTATATPVRLFTESDFVNRNPLTGELVDDPAVLQRRPIAIKISNSPPQYVRPQSGLSHADLVFEHPTEGPITRFTAIFYGRIPTAVGPIRSARLIDLEIPAMYDAALAYSGASIGVSHLLHNSDIRPRLIGSNESGYYRTGEDKPWEHTLYGDPEGFWQTLDERGENHSPSLATLMAFSVESPPDGRPASAININYLDWTTVDWEYDQETHRYWRWVDGEPHIDANTGAQLGTTNMVIVFANHQLDVTICEFQSDDACLAYSTEIQIWGRGPAIIFRDGLQYEVTWKREQRSHMLTFFDHENKPVPLQIGNTWFQIVPLHYVDPVTITPGAGIHRPVGASPGCTEDRQTGPCR